MTPPSSNAKTRHPAAPEPVDDIDRTTADDLKRFGNPFPPAGELRMERLSLFQCVRRDFGSEKGHSMSRAMNLKLSEAKVRDHCRTAGVEVSALEVLPGGGVRLVCASSQGAELLRTKLKSKLIAGEVQRTRLRADRPLT